MPMQTVVLSCFSFFASPKSYGQVHSLDWVLFQFDSVRLWVVLFFFLFETVSLRGQLSLQCCEILKLLCLLLLSRTLGCFFIVSSADFVARSVTNHVLGPEVVHTNRLHTHYKFISKTFRLKKRKENHIPLGFMDLTQASSPDSCVPLGFTLGAFLFLDFLFCGLG